MTLFSDLETKIINRLGSKKMSITNLARSVYQKAQPPLNSNNTISATIGQINKKCDYYELKWFIDGIGAGRGGRTVWKEVRK